MTDRSAREPVFPASYITITYTGHGMKIKYLVIYLLIFSYPIDAISWEINPHYSKPDTVNIVYNGKSLEDLKPVITGIPSTIKLDGIYLRRLVKIKSKNLQNDIMNFLNKNYPVELEQALASSGNMHNPKLKAIKEPLKLAVLDSTYVKEINRILNSICYTINDVSFEKLFIIKNESTSMFDAMTWLTAERLKNQSTLCT